MVQTISDGSLWVAARFMQSAHSLDRFISLGQRGGGDVGDRKEPGGPLQHLVQS